MKSFQLILEECITALSSDISTVDECLARYPQYASQMEPLLRTVQVLKTGRKLKPSPTFKNHSRNLLTQHLRFNQRQSRQMQWSWQVALALFMLVSTLFTTGTVHAQSVMPGDNFYPWKRASENVWLALSPDPVNTDIALANRRLQEWIAVANDPTLSTAAMNDYRDALAKLEAMDDVQALALIVPVLKSHQQLLTVAGLSTPELDDYLANSAGLLIPVTGTTQVAPTEIVPTAVTVPTSIALPAATDVPPTEVPSALLDVPATGVPTEIAPVTCVSNCGPSNGNSKGDGKDKADGKKDHNGDGRDDNGKGKGKGKGNK